METIETNHKAEIKRQLLIEFTLTKIIEKYIEEISKNKYHEKDK